MDRRSRWMRWGAVSAAAVAALTGCGGGEEPEPSASAIPSEGQAPSSQELLDEARDSYEGFLLASQEMWEEPDVDYTTLLQWASDEVATDEAAAHEALRAQGVARIGPVTINAFEPADVPSADEVDVWLCLDFSQARRLDSGGQDVTPPDAQELVPLQVRFEPDNQHFIITQQEALPTDVDSPCV